MLDSSETYETLIYLCWNDFWCFQMQNMDIVISEPSSNQQRSETDE